MPSVISHRVGKAYEQHKALLELVLLNLVSVVFSHERLTIQTTPRSGDKIADRLGLDQRKTKRLVDALTSHGLMLREFTGNKNIKVASNYMPTEKLLAAYAEYLYLDYSDFDNYEPIRVNRVGHDFKSTQDVMNSAVERLKKEAAKLGANGVLLNNVGRRDSNSVGVTTGTATAVGNTAFGYGVTTMFQGRGYQTISNTAIFVRD